MLTSSDQPIVPERVLYFGDGAGSGTFGATVSSGFVGGAQQLYLAYGSSGGLAGGTQATGNHAFVTLLNPSTSGPPLQVRATFTDASGQRLGTPRAVSMAAGTRQAIIVEDGAGRARGASIQRAADRQRADRGGAGAVLVFRPWAS